MKIAVDQFNPTVGDLEHNAAHMISAAKKAHASGARLMVTPELALCGYMPQDLLLRSAFLDACDRALEQVCHALVELDDFYLVVGHPLRAVDDSGCGYLYNAVSILNSGQCLHSYAQQVFSAQNAIDDSRYFSKGYMSPVCEIQGVRYGFLIGDDLHNAQSENLAQQAKAQGAQVLLALDACAFYIGGQREREARVQAMAAELQIPVVYANLVGGQDELVLEGGSFGVDRAGQLVARAKSFEEDVFLLDLNEALELKGNVCATLDDNAAIWHALVLGVRDYFEKNGFRDAVLGLSGGMDSALVLAVAVDALGADHVRTLTMPSPYTADISLQDAREMVKRLNVPYEEIAISPMFDAFKHALSPLFAGLPEDVTEENIQARIRGSLLMAVSNKTGALVLVTGNKSELATGYCTLYGDMAGGFAVIKDVLKTRVYELAWWRNANDPFAGGQNPIPERIITRAPSAELRLDQTDQDSLPDYAVLDEIIKRYVEENEDIERIVFAGIERAVVCKVARLIKIGEYKRQQAPIGIYVTRRAFGLNWRYPITSKFQG